MIRITADIVADVALDVMVGPPLLRPWTHEAQTATPDGAGRADRPRPEPLADLVDRPGGTACGRLAIEASPSASSRLSWWPGSPKLLADTPSRRTPSVRSIARSERPQRGDDRRCRCRPVVPVIERVIVWNPANRTLSVRVLAPVSRFAEAGGDRVGAAAPTRVRDRPSSKQVVGERLLVPDRLDLAVDLDRAVVVPRGER